MLFPLMETSEFLAEENPLYFWQFLDNLATRTPYIQLVSHDVDELKTLAVSVADGIAPGLNNILELMLATRAYSVKVEMFRQLALDSAVRLCGENVDTWAVFYQEPHCIESVACSVTELGTILHDTKQKMHDQVCLAAGVNDVELSVDHKYPHIPLNPAKTSMSVILYGLVGTDPFYAFHTSLIKQAQENKIQYMVRHYPRDTPLDTLLQGYGVALDIKNMEYKTIDDSKKTEEDNTIGDGEDDEDEEEDDIDDEEVQGFLFKPLMARHRVIAHDLKQFYDILVKRVDDEQEQELKAWHMKDLGPSAARAIVDAKNPLRMLQTLSQDFPLQAKKLAFSRKSITSKFREEVATMRMQAARNGLINKFIMNGIAIDPMERSFNVFDFMTTLRKEWSVAKQLGRLPLNHTELEEMLTHVRELNQEQPVVRVHMRGSMSGTTPLYLNNIETDSNSAGWPHNVNVLRRPAWNLIFVRKNMYECILVLDPLTVASRAALSHIDFMRARGAPVQWALLISSKELMASKTSDDRRALLEKYKAFQDSEKAASWHFAKLLLLAQAKDRADEGSGDQRATSTEIASAFVRRVSENEKADILVEHLLEAYADVAVKIGSFEQNEEEAMACLRSDQFDDEILAMTEFIHLKHVPLGSFVFNGVVHQDLEIQQSIMSNFGRDQVLYVDMAHRDLLDNEMDLVEELLSAQDAYPAFLSIFESPESRDEGSVETESQKHLFADDVDGRLKAAAQPAIVYLHAPGSRIVPKKQTIIFPADLSNIRDARYAYCVVKTILEDSEQSLRIGVVPQLQSNSNSKHVRNDVGELMAAILATVGHSDNESHLKFIMEALGCVIKQKGCR
ncbi:unnamed protein product [Peronospora belbahrii]|uniref:Uncharacterized protein n=1 Tax=Peronospora belbahrii TaxID=622444 RepID=A0ABN8CUZ1_9STRA|nr:unnamed protein product [Peronospora belbahrii]